MKPDNNKTSVSFQQLAPKLVSNGYTPLMIWPETKACFLPGWGEKTPQQLQDQVNENTDGHGGFSYVNKKGQTETIELNKCGTGIRCGDADLMGIDVDFTKEHMATIAMRILKNHLSMLPGEGKLVIRQGHAPKFLIPVRLPEGQSRRKATVVFHHANQEIDNQKIELLGIGGYFACSGIHPVTNKRFKYLTGNNVANTSLKQLPLVSWDWLMVFLDDLEKELKVHGMQRTNTGSLKSWIHAKGEGSKKELLNSDDPLSNLTGFESTSIADLEELYRHENFAELHYDDLMERCFEILHSVGDSEEIRDFIFNKTFSFTAGNASNRDGAEVSKRIAGFFERGNSFSGLKKTLNSAYQRKIQHDARQQRENASTALEEFLQAIDDTSSLAELYTVCDNIKCAQSLINEQRWSLSDAVKGAYKRSGLKPPLKPELQQLLLSPNGTYGDTILNAKEQIMSWLDGTGQYFMDQNDNAYVSLVTEGKRRSFKKKSVELRRLITVYEEQNALNLQKYDRDVIFDRIDARAAKSGDVRTATKRYGVSPDGTKRFEHLCDIDDTVIEMSAEGVRVIGPEEQIPCVFLRGPDSVEHGQFERVAPEELPKRIDEIFEHFPPTLDAKHQNQILGSLVDVSNTASPNSPTEIVGGSGSGKSTVGEFLMMLADSQSVRQASPSVGVRTLRANLAGNLVVVEQNATNYSNLQKNDICTAAENASIKEFEMRQNSGNQLKFDISTWFIVTAIYPVLTRTDLDDPKVGRINRITLKGKVADHTTGKAMEDLRQSFDEALPRMRNTLRALTAEVMRIQNDESISSDGHRWGSYVKACNCVARVRGQDWTYASVIGDSAEAMENAQLSDVFGQELEQLLQQQYTMTWQGTFGGLISELDNLFKGTMPSQLKRRAEDGGYPSSASWASRRLNDPEYQEALNQQGISVVLHPKSNGRKVVELSKLAIASAKAERDMARTRRGFGVASASDFNDLCSEQLTREQSENDNLYSQELRGEYPLDWLRKHSPWKLNYLHPDEVFLMHYADMNGR